MLGIGIIGYLIFIWALAQSIWLSLRWLNRTINPPLPPRPRFEWQLELIPSSYFAELAEQEIIAIMSKQAHDEICAIEDARVFAKLDAAK